MGYCSGVRYWLLLLLVFSCVLVTYSSNRSPAKIEEFCNMETFEAKCNEKEVVVMDTARYGRMRLGRCVKKNYGNIGCVKDVLTLADAKCSGRRECTVKLPDDDLYQMQPCPNDVTSHLETGYSCFPVVTAPGGRCSSHQPITIDVTNDSPEGYISGGESGHGACRWRLKAGPGQRLNVTVLDFGVRSYLSGGYQQASLCHRYASLKEPQERGGQVTNVCSDSKRIRNVYLSDSHLLDVTVSAPLLPSATDSDVITEDTPRFLLHYTAVGCPSPDVPSSTWVKRDAEKAEVTCNSTGAKAYLVCDGKRWVGDVGPCPMVQESTEPEDPDGLWEVLTHKWSTPYGILIIVGLGVGLGVFIGVLLLMAVLLVMKSRRSTSIPETGIDATSFQDSQNSPSTDVNTLKKNYQPLPTAHIRMGDSGYDGSTLDGGLSYTWRRGQCGSESIDGVSVCTCPAQGSFSYVPEGSEQPTLDIRDSQRNTRPHLPKPNEHVYELPK